jgi:hypothetical protein
VNGGDARGFPCNLSWTNEKGCPRFSFAEESHAGLSDGKTAQHVRVSY